MLCRTRKKMYNKSGGVPRSYFLTAFAEPAGADGGPVNRICSGRRKVRKIRKMRAHRKSRNPENGKKSGNREKSRERQFK